MLQSEFCEIILSYFHDCKGILSAERLGSTVGKDQEVTRHLMQTLFDIVLNQNDDARG